MLPAVVSWVLLWAVWGPADCVLAMPELNGVTGISGGLECARSGCMSEASVGRRDGGDSGLQQKAILVFCVRLKATGYLNTRQGLLR